MVNLTKGTTIVNYYSIVIQQEISGHYSRNCYLKAFICLPTEANVIKALKVWPLVTLDRGWGLHKKQWQILGLVLYLPSMWSCAALAGTGYDSGPILNDCKKKIFLFHQKLNRFKYVCSQFVRKMDFGCTLTMTANLFYCITSVTLELSKDLRMDQCFKYFEVLTESF